jgi:hypothetical protein
MCLWQRKKARVEETRNPTKGMQEHAPLIAQEVEISCQEILEDKKPLSKVKIVTNDDAFLEVLGDSGILMAVSASIMAAAFEEDEE